MGSLGFWEMVGLAVIALFVFGPERLPGMARSAGKTIAMLRREATKTLNDLKESAGLDDDIADVAREAKELRTSLKDVRKTAATALLGPMDDIRAEFDGVKADVRGAKADVERAGKGQSGPGMASLAPTAAGAVPGRAPFDPDAA